MTFLVNTCVLLRIFLGFHHAPQLPLLTWNCHVQGNTVQSVTSRRALRDRASLLSRPAAPHPPWKVGVTTPGSCKLLNEVLEDGLGAAPGQ